MPLRTSPCAKAGRVSSGNERCSSAHGVARSHYQVLYHIHTSEITVSKKGKREEGRGKSFSRRSESKSKSGEKSKS